MVHKLKQDGNIKTYKNTEYDYLDEDFIKKFKKDNEFHKQLFKYELQHTTDYSGLACYLGIILGIIFGIIFVWKMFVLLYYWVVS